MVVRSFLRRLADVAVGTPADGDALVYDAGSGKWTSGAVSGGSSTLAGLSDVTGTAGTGKAPVSNGAGAFPLTDIATQAELNSAVAAIQQLPDWFTSGDGSPNGTVVPSQGGALYVDFTNFTLYIAIGPLNTDWISVGGDAPASGNPVAGVEASHFNASLLGPAGGDAFISDVNAQGDGGSGDGAFWNEGGAVDGQASWRLYVGGGKLHAWEKDGTYKAPSGIAAFGATPPTSQPTAATIAALWTALKACGLIDSASTAPTVTGTNTGDQTSVTGNAGTATALATARNIDGQAFDGTASITVVAPGTHAATGKTTPVDADELPLVDSAASNVLKKLTWANLKATLKTYFDTLYSAAGAYIPGGTDVAVTDGGTGASTSSAARTNLGLVIGTDVQAHDADLDMYASITPTAIAQTILAAANAAAVRTAIAAMLSTSSLDAIATANATAADVAMNSHKITGLAAGASAGDSVRFEQLPTAVGAVAGQIAGFDGSNFANMAGPWAMAPGGHWGETVFRSFIGTDLAVLLSQRLNLYAIYLPKGITITSITFMSGGTGVGTGVHQLFGLFDNDAGTTSGTALALLRGSNDDTSTAWGTNSLKTLNLTSTYQTTRAGIFYIGILVQATTVPTLIGKAHAFGSTTIGNLSPMLSGASSSGVSALPNPAAAMTFSQNNAWAYVS